MLGLKVLKNHLAQSPDSVCAKIGETMLSNAFSAPYFVPASSVDPSSSTFYKNVFVFVYELIHKRFMGLLDFPVDHAIQVYGVAPAMLSSIFSIVFSLLSWLFGMYFTRHRSL